MVNGSLDTMKQGLGPQENQVEETFYNHLMHYESRRHSHLMASGSDGNQLADIEFEDPSNAIANNPLQVVSEPIPGEKQPSEAPAKQKTRVVHYGEPDYFNLLPPHLKCLEVFRELRLPLAHNSFGLYSLSFEIEIDNGHHEANED